MDGLGVRKGRMRPGMVPALLSLPRRPSDVGQVALHGVRWWAGEGLTAITRRMGMSCSAVSRRITAIAQRLRADPQFRNRVEQGTDDKIKTWPP
jgi:hypothetical protein